VHCGFAQSLLLRFPVPHFTPDFSTLAYLVGPVLGVYIQGTDTAEQNTGSWLTRRQGIINQLFAHQRLQ